MKIIVIDILKFMFGIIQVIVIGYLFGGIYKIIAMKKCGERLEATVVKAEKVNVKGSITYNVNLNIKVQLLKKVKF